MFEIIKTFHIEIYYAIVLSILFMSLLVGLSKLSVKSFLFTVWSYTSVILSDFSSLKIGSNVDHLLTGIWLLSCNILLIAFSGVLRDQMITSLPIFSINTLDDLVDRQNIRIDTFQKTSFIQFIEASGNDKYNRLINITNVTTSDEYDKG